MSDRVELLAPEGVQTDPGTKELEQLLAQPVDQRPQSERGDRIDGVRVGRLIGFRDPYEPLVIYPGQPGSAALVARASVDLCAQHIGQEVTLVFEDGNPQKPIVTGRIRVPSAWPATERPAEVEVDADGKRLTLTAREQLVLRCGKASLTLTAAGKVLIEGAYVSNRSSGVMRIKGGSIQLN
jgi:hypothetical protein